MISTSTSISTICLILTNLQIVLQVINDKSHVISQPPLCAAGTFGGMAQTPTIHCQRPGLLERQLHAANTQQECKQYVVPGNQSQTVSVDFRSNVKHPKLDRCHEHVDFLMLFFLQYFYQFQLSVFLSFLVFLILVFVGELEACLFLDFIKCF